MHAGRLRVPGTTSTGILVLIVAMILLTGERAALAAASTKRPNVLFLFSDDQRADTIWAWGNRHIRTPNLDKLVHAGFSFRANYSFGGNSGAVCVPSRAMVNTGRNWFHARGVREKHAVTSRRSADSQRSD